MTWVPAAGAALIAAARRDRRISDWSVEHTPLFGSLDRARRLSNDLRTVSHLGMIVTALTVPDREAPWRSRFKRLLVEQVGAFATDEATFLLKKAAGRERPDHSDDLSFPSAHSSFAFAYAASSRRNLDEMRLSHRVGIGWKIGLTAVAAGTAWARVEGGVHYPTDVLAGAALGNFVSLLLHDALLAPRIRVAPLVQLDRQQAFVGVLLSRRMTPKAPGPSSGL